LQQASSPGFEHWAKLFNLKESAKTLIFLQEHGITDYDMPTERAEAAKNNYGTNSGRRKEIDKRLGEITELQKHIGAYSKGKDILAEYNRLKKLKPTALEKFTKAQSPADKFYAENESAIISCRAAKEFFDEQGYAPGKKKLPTITMLKSEYAQLAAEKKKLYSGHKASREEMTTLLMAKQNVDRILFGVSVQTKKLERDAR